MQSRVFNLNWESFNFKDKEQRRQLAGALQCFCALPHRFLHPKFASVEEFVKAHKQIQEFTIVGDGWTNEKAIDIVKTLHLTPNYDRGYEQIFDVANYTGTKAGGFDIAAVRSGLTFREVKVGEKLTVYQMSGAKERVYFCYYGAALGWHRGLFEDGDWWTIEKNAIEFRNKAYYSKAATYYALLEAAADAKGCCAQIAADCTDCTADARSIVASINYAVTNIIENVKDRGYSLDPATTQFIVLTPLQLAGRVKQALNIQNQAFAGGVKLSDYNLKQVTTMMLTNTNRIMVILPFETLMIGERMDLSLFDDFDILSYTDTVAGWMRHGGCVGDIDQINCIELTADSGSCPPASYNPQVACGTTPATDLNAEDPVR